VKTTHASVLLAGSIVTLGVSVGCSAQVDPHPSDHALADATLALEHTFSDQFVKGAIDRSALAAPIDDVLQATAEPYRRRFRRHIEDVLQTAEQTVTTTTPEQRAKVAAAPETLGETQQAVIGAWGWPGAAGWGGYGAFGFPTGFATGFATGISCQSGYYSVNGWGTGGGGCIPF
jgi:hypothetical protein